MLGQSQVELPIGLEPMPCGVDNAVLGHRFRFLRLHRSTI